MYTLNHISSLILAIAASRFTLVEWLLVPDDATRTLSPLRRQSEGLAANPERTWRLSVPVRPGPAPSTCSIVNNSDEQFFASSNSLPTRECANTTHPDKHAVVLLDLVHLVLGGSMNEILRMAPNRALDLRVDLRPIFKVLNGYLGWILGPVLSSLMNARHAYT
jgi:hypothetical protein